MPFFSIIIPVLNSARTISVALESIRKQNFTDFEILIIDGLSTDNTLEIAKGYRDNRISIYSGKDLGIYDAMNKGIKMAKGDWIYFLGSDDRLFNSGVLQQINDEISNNNYDVIYGDVYSTRFNGRYGGEFNALKLLSQNVCHQAIFFKKSVFKTTGFFDLRYKAYADWDHNLHWVLSKKISKTYINLLVAEYADGGYSSFSGDINFENERILKYLLYSKSQLPIRNRIRLLRRELKKAANKQQRNLFIKLAFNIPRIIFGV